MVQQSFNSCFVTVYMKIANLTQEEQCPISISYLSTTLSREIKQLFCEISSQKLHMNLTSAFSSSWQICQNVMHLVAHRRSRKHVSIVYVQEKAWCPFLVISDILHPPISQHSMGFGMIKLNIRIAVNEHVNDQSFDGLSSCFQCIFFDVSREYQRNFSDIHHFNHYGAARHGKTTPL